MANQEQLRILRKEGVKAWNEYRKSHRNIKINLRGANLKKQNLEGADFSEADIRSTDFTGANLRGTNFTGAKCGLQRRWAIFLVFLSWLMAGISGFLSIVSGYSLLFLLFLVDFSKSTDQIIGWISLIVLIIFLIILLIIAIRRGMAAVAGVVIVAVAVALAFTILVAIVVAVFLAVAVIGAFAGVRAVVEVLAGAGITAVAGVVAGTVAGVVVEAVAGTVVVVFLVAGAVLFLIAGAVIFLIAGAGAVAVAILVAGVGVAAGSYIGWRAMKEDKRDAWLRSFAIVFAAIGGTSFRGADLTEANFIGVKLKSTDLREATLNSVRWYGAKMLDRVRPGNTYLNNPQLQQWLIGKGTDKNFNSQNLRGVNLQGTNLTDASFIGSDLSEANLQNANLSRAKLINTQLERTKLTGACIEDWNINSQTTFENVICDYIYLKKKWNQYQEKHELIERRPSDPNRNFEPEEFAKLVQKSVETVDLIFTDGIDWRALLSSYQDIQVEYGEENISIQAIEKKQDGAFVIRLNAPSNVDKGEIESKVKHLYETQLKILEAQYRAELKAKDKEIEIYKQKSADILELAKLAASRPITVEANAVIEKNNTSNQFNAPVGSVGNQGTQNNVTGEVKGDQIGTQHNYASPEKQTLAEAAAEIQKLLQQLEQNNPDATPEQQEAYVNAAIPPTLKQRCVGALKAGGETAIEEFLDNPYVNVGKAVVKAWIKPE